MTEQLNEQLNDLAALCATYPDDMAVEITRLRAQRDQLLAALSWIEDQDPQVVDAAREKFNLAAIAAVEEKP